MQRIYYLNFRRKNHVNSPHGSLCKFNFYFTFVLNTAWWIFQIARYVSKLFWNALVLCSNKWYSWLSSSNDNRVHFIFKWYNSSYGRLIFCWKLRKGVVIKYIYIRTPKNSYIHKYISFRSTFSKKRTTFIVLPKRRGYNSSLLITCI